LCTFQFLKIMKVTICLLAFTLFVCAINAQTTINFNFANLLAGAVVGDGSSNDDASCVTVAQATAAFNADGVAYAAINSTNAWIEYYNQHINPFDYTAYYYTSATTGDVVGLNYSQDLEGSLDLPLSSVQYAATAITISVIDCDSFVASWLTTSSGSVVYFATEVYTLVDGLWLGTVYTEYDV